MGIRLGVFDTISPEHSRDRVGTMPSEASLGSADHDRERTVADLKRELVEARARETASAAVLRLISRAGAAARSILAAIAKSATKLCGAQFGDIFLLDGDMLRFTTSYGASPEFKDYFDPRPIALGPGSTGDLAAAERRIVQIPDVLAEPGYQWGDIAKRIGSRTVLKVPIGG